LAKIISTQLPETGKLVVFHVFPLSFEIAIKLEVYAHPTIATNIPFPPATVSQN